METSAAGFVRKVKIFNNDAVADAILSFLVVERDADFFTVEITYNLNDFCFVRAVFSRWNSGICNAGGIF